MILPVRLAFPSANELLVAGAAVFLIELAVIATAAVRRNRSLSARLPPAVVVVPCAGAPERIRENALAVLDQEYPARLEFIFVLPSREDPGWRPINDAVAARPGRRARVLATDVVPTASSGKAADLAWALPHLPADAEIAVFTEIDLSLDPGWLKEMASALLDRSIGAATSVAVPVPGRTSLWGTLRMLWTAVGLPYFAALGMVGGQGMAVRTEDLRRLDVASIWSRSIADDLSLSAVLRRDGLGVRFVWEAMPCQEAACTAGEFWSIFNRWWKAFRVYEPAVFWLGPGVMAFKAYCIYRGAAALPSWGLLAFVAGGEFAMHLLRLAWLAREVPRSFASFPFGARIAAAAWGALLLPWIFLANFVSAMSSRRMRWGRRSYLVRGPLDVIVEPPNAPNP